MGIKDFILSNFKKKEFTPMEAYYAYTELSSAGYQGVYVAMKKMAADGILERIDRGVYRIASLEVASSQKEDIVLKRRNKEFLKRFYKVEGCQTPDGFLNKIVEQYKEELLKDII